MIRIMLIAIPLSLLMPPPLQAAAPGIGMSLCISPVAANNLWSDANFATGCILQSD
jgi:hypothetical protein